MKKRIKKAFTLVELLVVIAILAILATVSIVGYNSFTKKAKVSNDTVLVKQMNDILFANSQTDDKNPTMSKALEDVFDGGYDLTKLTPTTTGYSIVWDSINDQMVLLDDSTTKEPVYPEASKVSEKKDLFILTRNETEFNNTKEFAHYLSESFDVGTITTSTGIDTGRNEKVTKITYTGNGSDKNIINTNNGELVINAASDSVFHYGLADKVIIDNVASNSYHENGYVTSYLKVTSGRVVLEKKSSVSILAINGSSVTVDQKSNSELHKVVSVDSNTIDDSKIKVSSNVKKGDSISSESLNDMKYGGGDGKNADSAFELYTASHLAAFAKDVNNGIFTDYVYAKLCENVDISGMGWEPIGNWNHPFVGSFDGQEKTISGLTNKGYSPATSLWGVTSHSNNKGTAYGFFGVVGVKKGSTISNNNVVLKNIKFDNVNINIVEGANMLGTLFGADARAAKYGNEKANDNFAGNINVENVSTKGVVTCMQGASVGGIIGRVETLGKLLIKDCANNATLKLSNNNDKSHMKAGGILGFAQNGGEIEFNNCASNGDITLDAYNDFYIGGMISYQGGHTCPKFVNRNIVSSKIKISCKVDNIGKKCAALVYGNEPNSQTTKNLDSVEIDSGASCTIDNTAITTKYYRAK